MPGYIATSNLIQSYLIAAGATPTTGRVFYVCSVTGADTSNNGRKPTSPFATLAYALTQVVSGDANTGMVIYCMPGHAETIATAGAITCSVAGISIIGLGNGDGRPTFSWSGTASTWAISANNVLVKNIITIPSIDEVVSAFNITGTYCTLDSVDVYPVTSKQFIQWLTASTAASYLTIRNCYHRQGTASASVQVWINLVATTNTRIIDNDIDILANASANSILISGSTAVVGCEIARNYFVWRGASITCVVNCVTTSTGLIADNRAGITSTSGAITDVFTGDAMFKAQNFAIDVAGTASALLTPALGTYT